MSGEAVAAPFYALKLTLNYVILMFRLIRACHHGITQQIKSNHPLDPSLSRALESVPLVVVLSSSC